MMFVISHRKPRTAARNATPRIARWPSLGGEFFLFGMDRRFTFNLLQGRGRRNGRHRTTGLGDGEENQPPPRKNQGFRAESIAQEKSSQSIPLKGRILPALGKIPYGAIIFDRLPNPRKHPAEVMRTAKIKNPSVSIHAPLDRHSGLLAFSDKSGL